MIILGIYIIIKIPSAEFVLVGQLRNLQKFRAIALAINRLLGELPYKEMRVL